MGLCYSRGPSIRDEDSTEYKCFKRRKHFSRNKPNTNTPHSHKVLGLSPSEQLQTASHGSSTIRIGPDDRHQSTCSVPETTNSVVSRSSLPYSAHLRISKVHATSTTESEAVEGKEQHEIIKERKLVESEKAVSTHNPEPLINPLPFMNLSKERRVGTEDEFQTTALDGVVSTSEESNDLHHHDRYDTNINITTNSSSEYSNKGQSSEIDKITNSLRSSSIFQDLDQSVLQRIALVMRLETYFDGDVIIWQGDLPQNSDCMYCVASGEVLLQISETKANPRTNDDDDNENAHGSRKNQDLIVKKMGWVFGDLSLLFNSPRSASVIASGECTLYTLDRVTFLDLMKNVYKIRLLRFLRKLPILKSVSDNKLVNFGRQVETIRYHEGDLILDQLQNNKRFYIIRKGNVRILHDVCYGSDQRKNSQSLPTTDVLSRGHFFGIDEKMPYAVYAASKMVELVVVKHQVYQKLGNMPLYMKIIEDSVLSILIELETVDVRSVDIDNIVNQKQLNTAQAGDVIVKKGEDLKYLYLVIKGKVDCTKRKNNDCLNVPTNGNKTDGPNNDISSFSIKVCNSMQYFGHCWWKDPYCPHEDIIVTSNQLQFLKIPHKVLSDASLTQQKSSSQKSPKLPDRILHALPVGKNENSQIAFHDLKQHRVVGEGQYGKVRLAVHKHTGQRFALKIIHKTSIKDTKTVEHVIMERKVLSRLSGENFLVGFHGAFQDERSLYLLMDWIPGGELFTRITLKGMLPESHAVFYAANVVLAFNTMHNQNIIYRDLKPENILLDTNGYLRLSDYGFATIADSSALTLCGTPDYQAPEIISRKGALRASDYWSLGVLIFEMLTGDAPFKSMTDDPWDTYRRILSGRFYIPEYVSHSAASLILALLQVDPCKRLGYQPTAGEDIKSHDWFKNVNWERLKHQQVRAPFVPSLTNSLDTSCFDYYENSSSASLPSPEHNFFTRDHHEWAHLWSWIDTF